MAKLMLPAGATSQTVNLFIQDSTSTTGAGKTGLVYNTGSLVAYYVRPKAVAASITLATQTVTGAWSTGGFVEIDATNMPGWYRFDIPNAALATGVTSVGIHFKGATGMAPLPLEIDLGAIGAIWDEINTGSTHNITNSTGKQLRSLATGNDAVIYPPTGTVTLASATGSTATLDSGASNSAQAYQWDVINILTGTGAGQSRIITDYTTGRIATVTPAWSTTPDNTSGFDITPTASVQVVSYVSGQSPDTLVWNAVTRTLSAGTNIVLAKGTGITGFNDIAATAIVSAGAINTSSGAVSTVTTLTNLPTAPTDWLTALALKADAVTEIQSGLATSSQIPAHFTNATFVSDGVFATAALANAPTGGGGGGDIVSVNGNTFSGANVPCVLADGVAHGGTPGSSTASFALEHFRVNNPNGSGVIFESTYPQASGFAHGLLCRVDGNGFGINAIGPSDITAIGGGIQGYGGAGAGTGFSFSGGDTTNSGQNHGGVISGGIDGSALKLLGPYDAAATASILSLADNGSGNCHGVEITAAGTGKHGIFSTGGTDGDGFHGVGAGTGTGFNSTPDATGFGSTFDVSSDSVKLDLTQVIGGTATLADALKAAYAQGAGVWDLNTGTKVLTLKNKDGSTFIQFDLDSVTAPTYRHIH